MIGTSRLEAVESGPTAGNEIRQTGRRTAWLIRLGEAGGGQTLQSFSDGLASLGFTKNADGSIVIEDPEYGDVVFGDDGTVRAEGRLLTPASWTVMGEMRYLDEPRATWEAGS